MPPATLEEREARLALRRSPTYRCIWLEVLGCWGSLVAVLAASLLATSLPYLSTILFALVAALMLIGFVAHAAGLFAIGKEKLLSTADRSRLQMAFFWLGFLAMPEIHNSLARGAREQAPDPTQRDTP